MTAGQARSLWMSEFVVVVLLIARKAVDG